LKKSVNDRQKLLEGLNTIESTGEGLVHFITDYRKLSALPPPKKDAIPLHMLFRHIESLFSEECKSSGVELIVNAGEGELQLEADRYQLEQILINLIRNAIESLKDIDSGRIVLSAEREKGNLLIQVTDNGPGIPDEMADKIFVPFYSTKAGGSGIGLSLSRQIMHNHGGLLGYESIPGERTTFSIRFPLND
jgi:signal transduction histidine kinase